MKKLLFGVLALGLLMTACEKDKEDSSSLKVSAESISFTKDASKKSIFIESNVQWAAISSDTTWCKLQPGRGVNSDSLYVTALENDNLTERTANITVTGEGLSAKTIQVKQMGKEPHLALSSDSISYTAVASKKSIFVECNVQWVAISSDTTWCKLQPGHGINSDSLYITALENVNQAERTASITITAEGLTKTIQVKQAATPARLVKELLMDGKTVLAYEYDNLNRIVKYNMARGSGSDFMRYSLSYSGSNLVKSKYTVDGETYKDSTITTYSKTGNVIAFLENSFKNNIQTKESSGEIYLTSDGKSVDKIDYDSTYTKKTVTFKGCDFILM